MIGVRKHVDRLHAFEVIPGIKDGRHLTREGGHSARRIVHVTDATGAVLDMALGIWLVGLAGWHAPGRRRTLVVAGALTALLTIGIAWQAQFDRALLADR